MNCNKCEFHNKNVDDGEMSGALHQNVMPERCEHTIGVFKSAGYKILTCQPDSAKDGVTQRTLHYKMK